MFHNIKSIILSSNLILVLLSLQQDIVLCSEVKRLGSPDKYTNEDHNHERQLFKFKKKNLFRDIVSNTGNTINNAANDVGNAVDDVGSGIDNVLNNAVSTIGDGLDNAGDSFNDAKDDLVNKVQHGLNNVDDFINDAMGSLGLGQRCGVGGVCDGDFECQGGAFTGLCLPVKCIADKLKKHAMYFEKLLNTTNGGGIEFAKNYISTNIQERDGVGTDFKTCFHDEGSGRKRNLAGSIQPIHAVGALGELNLIASGSFHYMYVAPFANREDSPTNIVGVCGGVGAGAGVSIKPTYDLIFSDSVNDAVGSWTFARFELVVPVPMMTIGFGIHVGVNTGRLLEALEPIFDLRITLSLPVIGGFGANFASIATCQSRNLN